MKKLTVLPLKFLIIGICLITVANASAKSLPSWTPTMRDVEKMELNFRNELAGEFHKVKVAKKQSRYFAVSALDGQLQPQTFVEQFLELTRISVLVGAFAEVDLKVIEFKIQPYVEFRFDK